LLDTRNIQLPFNNKFHSVWEYQIAIEAKEIDFIAEVGKVCPVCGTGCGFRKVTYYARNVVDLIECREGKVLIPRFQCRKKLLTFSLLPHQLVPYHKYTLASIVLAVAVVFRFRQECGAVGLEASLAGLSPEYGVTTWLLRCWVNLFVKGLRCAHHVLSRRLDFTHIRSGGSWDKLVIEVGQYLLAVGIINPGNCAGIHAVAVSYSRATGNFLIGTPSQLRRGVRLNR
jgi:hypothetical protein